MKNLLLISCLLLLVALTGCNRNKSGNTNASNPTSKKTSSTDTAAGKMTIVPRPQSVVNMMNARGDQDEAKPTLTIESPKDGDTISSSTVRVKATVGGDTKGLVEGKDSNGMGNHIHVILDDQPYAAYYMWGEEFELRNVQDGNHTLRMFVSRPWHESYKNQEAFKAIKFTVKQGNADVNKPTTDDKGNTLADSNAEGADMQPSEAGDVDFAQPLLTYSRPKGQYSGADADPIMLDFWVSNVTLASDGGDFSVRCTINNGEPIIIEKWEAIWLSGWNSGTNSVKLELLDSSGAPVNNGGYNDTIQEITVTK